MVDFFIDTQNSQSNTEVTYEMYVQKLNTFIQYILIKNIIIACWHLLVIIALRISIR